VLLDDALAEREPIPVPPGLVEKKISNTAGGRPG
jgi:hypothetical protein